MLARRVRIILQKNKSYVFQNFRVNHSTVAKQLLLHPLPSGEWNQTYLEIEDVEHHFPRFFKPRLIKKKIILV